MNEAVWLSVAIGSSFPMMYAAPPAAAAPAAPAAPVAVEWQVDPARIPVAVVEDSADGAQTLAVLAHARRQDVLLPCGRGDFITVELFDKSRKPFHTIDALLGCNVLPVQQEAHEIGLAAYVLLTDDRQVALGRREDPRLMVPDHREMRLGFGVAQVHHLADIILPIGLHVFGFQDMLLGRLVVAPGLLEP